MADATFDTVPHEMPPEAAQLPQRLSGGDLGVLAIFIVLFMTNTSGVQYLGPAAFIYWVLGVVALLLPCAYIVQWFGRRLPGGDSAFAWTAATFGSHWSFFAAFCGWIPGMLAGIAAIEGVFFYVQAIAPTWFTTPAEQCAGIGAVLLGAVAVGMVPLRRLRHGLRVVAALYVGVFALIGVAGVLWLHAGHAPAVSLAPRNWLPTGENFSGSGVVALAMLGLNAPLFMAGEVRGPRHRQRRAMGFVWWATGIIGGAYLLGTFGIMMIVPPDQAGGVTACIVALQAIFGANVATGAALVLVLSHVTIAIIYVVCFSRLLVTAARYHRLPPQLLRVTRSGAPLPALLAQAGFMLGTTLLTLIVVPTVFTHLINGTNLALIMYNVLLAACSLVWAISIILLFGAALIYARQHQQTLPCAVRRALVAAAVVGSCAALVGIWQTAINSWITSVLSNQQWTIFVLGATGTTLAIGWFVSEMPRMHSMLNEQRQLHAREIALHQQLQGAYRELDRLYQEQRAAAVTDAITGLPNHRAVMDALQASIEGLANEAGSCAVLFVDIDHFKAVNDTWGHRAGDAILHEVAQRLRGGVRTGDLVGRYGGEEFAIILHNVLDSLDAYRIAEELRRTVAAAPCLWQAEGDEPVAIAVTASFGVALAPQHGHTRETLIHAADQAMYVAKRGGRDRVWIAEWMHGIHDLLPAPSDAVTPAA